MWKSERMKIATAAAVLAGSAVLWWGVQALRAQPKPKEPPAYQYVGVQQTIARIDARTGRIEVLYKRGDPKASLLTPDHLPWEWREVRVREPRGAGEPQEPPTPKEDDEQG